MNMINTTQKQERAASGATFVHLRTGAQQTACSHNTHLLDKGLQSCQAGKADAGVLVREVACERVDHGTPMVCR